MNKQIILAIIAIIAFQAVAFSGDCQTDNGKKISNCEIKRE